MGVTAGDHSWFASYAEKPDPQRYTSLPGRLQIMGMTRSSPMLTAELFKKLIHGLFNVLITLSCLSRFPQLLGLLLLLATPLDRDDITDDPFHAELGDLLVQDRVFCQPPMA
jgi:hypothetical protein